MPLFKDTAVLLLQTREPVVDTAMEGPPLDAYFNGRGDVGMNLVPAFGGYLLNVRWEVFGDVLLPGGEE